MLSFERQPDGRLISNVLPFSDARLAFQALGFPPPPEDLCQSSLPVRIFIHDNPDGPCSAVIGVVVLSGEGISEFLEDWPQSSS